MRRLAFVPVLVLVACLTLIAAACSSDAGGGADTVGSSDATTTDDTAAPAGPGVAAVAGERDDLATFTTAVEAAGLVDTLAGAGPFTVFAPTNAAFAAMPDGTFDELLFDRDGMRALLLLHVVDGRHAAAELAGLGGAASSAGPFLTFEATAAGVAVGGATVVTADIPASNGVIHIIDTVLQAPPSLHEVIRSTPELSTFTTTIDAANLAEIFSTSGPYTIFAPTNDAFRALPFGALEALFEDPAAMQRFVEGHMVRGRLPAAEVAAAGSLESVKGRALPVTADGATVRVDGAAVVTPDVQAANGVLHRIDAVLDAPPPPQQ